MKDIFGDLNDITAFLTLTPKSVKEEFHIDWDDTIDFEAKAREMAQDEWRWVTAIQKVSPRSGSFWFDYGHRYNEKVLMKICPDRDPQGRKCCDVQLFTRRTIGDVVFSAWTEYNRFLCK